MELAHGFTTRKEWQNYFEVYFEQIRKIEEYVAFSMDKESQQWIEQFKQKAILLEQEYHNHEEYLQRHVYYFIKQNNPWIKEVADSLLAYLFRFCTHFEDIHVAYDTANSLYSYYENLEDEVAIMKCEMVIMTCYLFLDFFHYKKAIIECCRKGIAILQKYYDELSEEDKSLGMSFYDFLSVASCETINVQPYLSGNQLIVDYKQRMKGLERFMEEADMSLKINQVLPYFKNCWTSSVISMPVRYIGDVNQLFSDEQLYYLKSLCEQMCDISEKDKVAASQYVKFQLLNEMLGYYLKLNVASVVVDHLVELEKLLNHQRMLRFEDFDDETLECFNLLIRSFTDLSKEDARAKGKIFDIFYHLMDVYNHFPNTDYLEHIADNFILTYLIPALRYMSKKEALITLLKLTIFRQPQTAFHTVMVSECAKLVASYMIELKPQLLIGILNCENVEQVQQRKAELLDYVKDAALLHDIGKILCSNVINMQYRKLIDLEFEVIKFHPSTSEVILNSIPSLKEFSDVAVGHHKSYDGSFGYPAHFDNTKSDKKILIDLITVCDTLDAATDYLGRSYARTKELAEVLDEMKAQANVRYAKVIVDLIDDSQSLQMELNELLRHKREMISQHVVEYMKKHRM